MKWELGFAFFLRLGNGILCTVNGIHERKTIEKWEWDFNLSNRQAGIVEFSFLRVTVVLMKVRSDLYGITILQFFRSIG